MIDGIKDLLKKFFSEKNIIDDIVVGKGISELVERIPDPVIDFLAALGDVKRELALGAVAFIINEIIPEDKRKVTAPIIETLIRELGHRVDHHSGKDKKDKEEKKNSETVATESATQVAIRDRWSEITSLPLDPVFGTRGKAMNKNLYNLLNPTGNVNYDNCPEEYTKRLVAGLCKLEDEDIIYLLRASEIERNMTVSLIVGKIETPKAKKTFSEMATELKAGALCLCTEVGLTDVKTNIDAHIITRTVEINAQKGKWWSIF